MGDEYNALAEQLLCNEQVSKDADQTEHRDDLQYDAKAGQIVADLAEVAAFFVLQRARVLHGRGSLVH